MTCLQLCSPIAIIYVCYSQDGRTKFTNTLSRVDVHDVYVCIIYICTYECKYVYTMYVCMYMNVCMNVSIYVYTMYVCMYIYKYMYM